MVRFCPFKGYLPSLSENEDILDRVSPPYDVIEEPELSILRSKPLNVARITLGDIDGDYQKAAKELTDWISKGALVKDEEESYYLYRQSFKIGKARYVRTGLIGLLGLEEYGEGDVVPHEETISNVKEDRLRLLRATDTQAESIFGLVDDWDDLTLEKTQDSSQKLFECEDSSGTLHSISRISGTGLTNEIADMMSDRRVLIADGHHRYETALRYFKEAPEIRSRGWVLATLVSSKDRGVVVFPTHRLLEVPDLEEDRAVQAMRKYCVVEKARNLAGLSSSFKRTMNPSLGVIFKSGSAYKAEMIEWDRSDPMWDIDSFVFQEVMLRRIIYSIAQPDKVKIDYDHDASSVESKIRSGAYDLSVLLRPPKIETIWKLAIAGRRMPKKTTYFWPKIWSGFVFYRMT
jgi:uncharacterized protein (DUF1015 family)